MKIHYNSTKVLFCSNSSWNVYNFRLNLIKKLISKKYIVSVLSPRDKFTENLINIGCEYHDIKLNRSNINLKLLLNALISIPKSCFLDSAQVTSTP